ncbi:unnamed protein product [Staurois parvus]|uniref:HMG box domain-containing protein n=1 Tax=Staurois parvus TaxID=386267 RepID=A0ABN9F3K9_9NEOB|nr:unnamed protein product [Staurois parvus]
MNAYMIWSRIHRPVLKQAHPGTPFSIISGRLGEEWNKLTVEQQQPYYDEAKRLKRKHSEEHPSK